MNFLWRRFVSRYIGSLSLFAIVCIVCSSLFFSGCVSVSSIPCEFACKRTPDGFVAIRKQCTYNEGHAFAVFATRCAAMNAERQQRL